MVDVVDRTASKVFIPLTVGGGIRSVADARKILLAGADKVSVNTAAVRRPELITELSQEFGAQAVVLAIDARRVPPGAWHVYTKGGRVRRGHRCRGMGGARREPGRRRDPADLHGHRRCADRLRLRAYADRLACNAHPGNRLRRRGQAGALPGGVHRGRGRRGAGGFHLPLRHLHRGRPEGIPRQERCPRTEAA